MNLRPYQQDALDAIVNHLRFLKEEHAICQLPTGAGKSHVIAELTHRLEGRVLVLAHRKELLEQNASKFSEPVSIFSAGLNSRDLSNRIVVAGIQSIYNKELPDFDYIIIDECHLVTNNPDDGSMYWQLINSQTKARIIGFTATPYRTEDGPLIWGRVCFDYSVSSLVKQGFLCPLTNKIAKTQAQISGVQTRLGDYIQSQLEEVMLEPELFQASIQNIKANHKNKTLVFCSGVKHAELLAEGLNENDIFSHAVTGDTKNRDEIIEWFKNGSLECITNCNVLTTGFDAPNIDTLVMLRPTKSRCLHDQMLGRGTRLHEGKNSCLVIDMAGNLAEHGALGEPRWKYERGKKIENKKNGLKPCPSCETAVAVYHKECPECGFEWMPDQNKASHNSAADTKTNINDDSYSPIREYLIDSVSYSKHISKNSGKELMKVTYYCGYESVQEYVCIGYDGFAGQKADTWLKKHIDDPIPFFGNLDDTLKNTHLIKQPTKIFVTKDGDYDRIVSHEYGTINPNSTSEMDSEEFLQDEIPF